MIHRYNQKWREVIRNAVHPPRVYTYACDDDSGTLGNPDDMVEIHFFRVCIINMLYYN